MFLTKEERIKRFINKVLYGLKCFAVCLAATLCMILLFAIHNYLLYL